MQKDIVKYEHPENPANGTGKRGRTMLLVSDDARSRRMLAEYLARNHFLVATSSTKGAIGSLQAGADCDVVVIDSTAGAGLTALCQRTREVSTAPIVIVASGGSVEDRIAGLRAGADDYIVKPVVMRELLERIRALERRVELARRSPVPRRAAAYRFANWRLDVRTQVLVHSDGQSRTLSTTEFLLVHLFVTHPMEVMSRANLMAIIHGREWHASDRSIDTRVSRLRQILRDTRRRGSSALIRNVYGKGYALSCPVCEE